MDKYVCSILNVIANYCDYKDFNNRITIMGRELKNSGKVSEVKIISDLEITAKVDNKEIYDLVFKVESPKKLKMSCSCNFDMCHHEQALVYYLKDNLEILDYDYCINKNLVTNSFTTSILNKLMSLDYYSIRSIGIKRVETLNNKLYENIMELLKDNPNEETYYLFYRIISYYLKNQSCFIDKQNEANLIKTFYDYIPNNFKVWRQVLYQVDIKLFIPLFQKSYEYIDNEEKTKAFIKLIDATIKELNQLMSKADAYTSRRDLLLIALKLSQKYYQENDYKTYLMQVACYHPDLEALLANLLYKQNAYEEIKSYCEIHKTHSSTISLALLAIKYQRGYITLNDYLTTIIEIFKEQCSLNDFNFVRQVLDNNYFLLIKDKMLRLAKKVNKYNYYEMEINLDLDNGFNLLKKAGIFVFNNHVTRFLPEKEEEVTLYYQEELYQFFCKNKGTGLKFQEAMFAAGNLMKMKNGKYYLFSVYRMAKNAINEYSEALQQLSYYISQQDL